MKKPIKSELIRYSVFPSVVEADKESVVCIESHDNRMLFCDDIVYDVEFIPSDISDVPHDDKMSIRGYEKNRKKYTFRPENGVLKIKHFFSEEQKWTIHICTKEYSKCDNPLNKLGAPHFEWYRQFPERGVYLEIYSLKPDLYNKRVLRGDLHVHTSLTDGNDSPWLVATEYRRAGYDFIAITDHNLYDVGRYARDRINFKTDFKVLTGEEIHNGFGGHLHILNIGGKKSINDMYLNEPDKIEQGISELEKTVQVPEGIDKKEFLHRTFIYNEVNKSGGLVIYPHPYWNIEHRWHVGYKAALQILKNGLCDAFEIMGGGTPAENNMQAVMYDELLAEGKRLPLVASTDCHAVMESTMFCAASTIIFDDSNNITEAVKRGDCIAVEHPANETSRLYGPYRLARYASFLIDNYFPVHNRLCQSSGQVMTDYVLGDTKLFDLLEALEKRVVDFEAKFFGR